jgi:nucleoside-diphosphate-sugar epimerase
VRRVCPQEFDPRVEIVVGDLSRPESYIKYLSGAASVVHTALTDNFVHDLQCTTDLVQAAMASQIKKFIHLSSIAVYGNPVEGLINEETARLPTEDAYSRSKAAIEEFLQRALGIREVIVLRLGCVYGPGGGWWSHSLLSMMEHGKLILVDDGVGIANLIHVSDVSRLISAVLSRSNAPFEVYNVTDGMPVTWGRYFSELESIAGRPGTISMSVAEARDYGTRWHRPSFVRRLIRKLGGGQVIFPLEDMSIERFSSRAIYSNQKAANELGFTPEYDLRSGMRTVKLQRTPTRR